MTLESRPRKRLLFVITQSEMGGAQRFLVNLLPRLGSQTYEILVAVGRDGDGALIKELGSIGIAHITIPPLRREERLIEDIRAVLAIKKLVKNFRPDTLFLCSSKAGFIGSLAARWTPKVSRPKVIYRIGGWTFNDPWPSWKRRVWIILERLSAKWKNVIIVNNKHDLDQANRLKIRPRQELVLIHNCIDPYKMEFLAKDEARLKLFEKAGRISGKVFQAEYIVGTIANFYSPKGLEYLVKAASDIENDKVVFFIIGDGAERPKLENLIKELRLEHRVFLLGHISEAYRYLSAFDIFVLSSVKEGFPWVILEAMAAKLPIIASRVGAIPEIIEDGKSGIIVEAGNSKDMAQKISELLDNDRLQKELGIQAHQTVLFKFPLDKMIQQTESLL